MFDKLFEKINDNPKRDLLFKICVLLILITAIIALAVGIYLVVDEINKKGDFVLETINLLTNTLPTNQL